MSFLFSNLSIDIENMIEKNITYRKNMNNVINHIKTAGAETERIYLIEYELTQEEYEFDFMVGEMLQEYTDQLDISFNFMVNEEIWDDPEMGRQYFT